ncbi:MAG: helix-turn-helix transcriptional regulator [Spirochaetales bacterium]|nr:helix-turn-helix transcriptional regulator [Spirochaetales bacterium]
MNQYHRSMLLSFLMFFVSPLFPSPDIPVIMRGNLDCSSYDFSVNAPVPLEGLWGFYWREELNQKDLKKVAADFCYFPSSWTYYILNNQPLPALGFATYHLHIKISKSINTRALGLKIPVIYTAYKLIINDREVYESGQFGTSKDTMRPYIKSVVLSLPETGEEFDLILQISNFYNTDINGSIVPLLIGDYERLSRSTASFITMTYIILSGFLLITVFLIFLWAKYRRHWFLCFLIVYGLFAFLNTTLFEEMVIYHFFPMLTYEILIKLSSLLAFTGGSIVLSYVRFRFPDETLKPLVYISWISTCGLTCTMFFLDASVFDMFSFLTEFAIFITPFLLFSEFFIAYALFICVLAVMRRRKSGIFHLVTFVSYILITYEGFNGSMFFGVSLIQIASLVMLLSLSLYYFFDYSLKKSIAVKGLRLPGETIAVDLSSGEAVLDELSLRKEYIDSSGLTGSAVLILSLLLEGKCAKEIAQDLGLSVRTVENYTYRIYKKFKIKSRSEILTLYYNYRARLRS